MNIEMTLFHPDAGLDLKPGDAGQLAGKLHSGPLHRGECKTTIEQALIIKEGATDLKFVSPN